MATVYCTYYTCTEGRPIIHIRGLSEGAVCPTNIMMVSANYHRGLSKRKKTQVCVSHCQRFEHP